MYLHIEFLSLISWPQGLRYIDPNQAILIIIVQIHQCGNATHYYVSCPTGYCKAGPKDLQNTDMKEVLALAGTCRLVRSEILKLFYQDNVLYFSCTCALGFCLSRNEFVRQNVQRIKFHLRGPQDSHPISLLRICPNLKELEVTVSKWSTFYRHQQYSQFTLSPHLPFPPIDPPLRTANGVSELLGIPYLESVKVSHASVRNMFNRNAKEVNDFETYLKERLEGRGLLKVNIADLVAWLDKRMKL